MVLSWILNSVHRDVIPSRLYAETTYEVWCDLKERFSPSNGLRIYALENGCRMGKEEGGSVTGNDDRGTGGAERQRALPPGMKLRRGLSIAKKGGPPFTPAPAWKLEVEEEESEEAGRPRPSWAHNYVETPLGVDPCGARLRQHRSHRASILIPSPASTAAGAVAAGVSARKLGANLWEIQENLKRCRMSRRGTRYRHARGEELPELSDLPPRCPRELPRSASSLRRYIADSSMQHRKSTERGDRVLQPVSPACYSSSIEVAACNPAVAPSSSDHKDRQGCSLKTSTELLKVLNRIWRLEEQHASNTSLVKTLKFELEHAYECIQKLLSDKRSDRREIDDLTKQITEKNLVGKNKERDELAEERRLRKRSERLHRKLAQQLSELNSAFSSALHDLQREKAAHESLQHLCDVFAKGVLEYEREKRDLKQMSAVDGEIGCGDRPVIHISEAWLDGRLQAKQAGARGDHSEKKRIMERLTREIESLVLGAAAPGRSHSHSNAEEDSRFKSNAHPCKKEKMQFRRRVVGIHTRDMSEKEGAGADEDGDDDDVLLPRQDVADDGRSNSCIGGNAGPIEICEARHEEEGIELEESPCSGGVPPSRRRRPVHLADDNTLRAKLLEARLEVQQRARRRRRAGRVWSCYFAHE